jgi:hypothetical protein
MAPSEIHGSLLGSQGPGPIFRLNPSLIGPVYKVTKLCMFITTVLLKLNICSCLYFFSLFRYVIWTFCCTGNKAFMKVYQWFYWTSNPQFWEKSQLRGPKALQHISYMPCLYNLCDGSSRNWPRVQRLRRVNFQSVQ